MLLWQLQFKCQVHTYTLEHSRTCLPRSGWHNTHALHIVFLTDENNNKLWRAICKRNFAKRVRLKGQKGVRLHFKLPAWYRLPVARAHQALSVKVHDVINVFKQVNIVALVIEFWCKCGEFFRAAAAAPQSIKCSNFNQLLHNELLELVKFDANRSHKLAPAHGCGNWRLGWATIGSRSPTTNNTRSRRSPRLPPCPTRGALWVQVFVKFRCFWRIDEPVSNTRTNHRQAMHKLLLFFRCLCLCC